MGNNKTKKNLAGFQLLRLNHKNVTDDDHVVDDDDYEEGGAATAVSNTIKCLMLSSDCKMLINVCDCGR